MNIYIIDPKESPREVEITDRTDLCLTTSDLSEINDFQEGLVDVNGSYVDSYVVARKYIEEYNKQHGYEEHPFIQRVGCLPWKNLGLYVDESGRIDGQEANRKILFNNGRGSICSVEICGRLVVIPETILYGYVVAMEVDRDIEVQLSEFMHYNDNDGQNDLQRFTNEDAINNKHTVESYNFDDIKDFWKFLNGLD